MQQHTEIGQLDENEVQQIETYRKAANNMIQQIGQLEIQKARVLRQLGEVEERAQFILNAAKVRFGLGQNDPCLITPDGKVMAVKDVSEEPQQH